MSTSTPPPLTTNTPPQQSPVQVMPQIVYQQPMIIAPSIASQLGQHSVTIQCPKCMQVAPTFVIYSNGNLVYLSALVICCVGGSLGCCFIPFCIDDLKDAEHRCSLCKQHLGWYKRI